MSSSDINALLDDRTAQEVDARLRRRLELVAAAAERQAEHAAREEARTISLTKKIDKWNEANLVSANSHSLKSPEPRPLGSQYAQTFVALFRLHVVSPVPRFNNPVQAPQSTPR
jgi:hypothetical protein